MIRRFWRRLLLATVVIIALALIGVWWWKRPAPPPTVERMSLTDGAPLVLVTPASRVKTQVALAVPADQLLSDKQLTALSQDASARIVQVVVPKDDCEAQAKTFAAALDRLGTVPTVVGGIGPGASLAWRWLAAQDNDKASAISAGFVIDQPGCQQPWPKSAAHGKWMVAWNDAPDDPSAAFVRDQPNADTSISDYDISLPQVLNGELRHQLVGGADNGGLNIPIVEVPSGQPSDTVTLFLSGDGGWRDLDKEISEYMAKVGYPVVGVDTLRYYWEHKSPEQTAADLTELMAHYRQKWGAKRFILAGYSFGADVLPAIYNRMGAEQQERIDGMILLAFARSGSFEIAVEGWLGATGKEAATGPEMDKVPGDKVFCVYGVEETNESGCTEATMHGEKLQLPGGHHFDENYPALAKRLEKVIDKWKGKAPKDDD